MVNGAKSGTWLIIEREEQLYASRDALEEWRLLLDPDVASIKFKGQEYWPLAAIPGYRSKLDFANQSVELLFAPQAFSGTRLGLKVATELAVDRPVPSLFVNYDINYQRSALRGAPGIENLGMLNEIGFSSELGVLTTTAVGQNLTDHILGGGPRRFLRLETTLTTHQPDQKQTLRIGDSATRPGMFGSTVYFGGVRFGTNFNLTPGFISQPVPILSGSSSAPSTVSLYVNDVLRQTSNVPTGPFAIDNFPILTGGGEARLVVRDLLGRETVTTQSFFTSTRLLAPDLNDWSLEAGKVRQDLGTYSNHYGATFARGLWRHGYSDRLSFGGVTEVSANQKKLEFGFTSSLLGQWLGNVAIAASNETNLGNGHQWLLGLERQQLRTGIYLQAQGATENFRELGQGLEVKPLKLQLAGNVSYSTPSLGVFGVGFASVTPYDSGRVKTMSMNYSMSLSKQGSLNLSLSHSQGATSASAFGLSLVWPLPGNGPVISGSSTRNGKELDYYVATAQNPTLDGKLGWRVLAGQQQKQARAEGGVQYFGPDGNLSGDVSSSPNQNSLRVSGSGGLVVTDGNLFVTRRATESYALVEVGGYPNVGVGLGSNTLTKTNTDGIALIPNLAPYQQNQVRLNPQDLPLSAEIDSIEHIASPGWRSVVRAKFPVRAGRGALLRIRLDDNDVVPPGAVVRIEGDDKEFYVARRGEAFVTGLQTKNLVILKWKERQCRIEVDLPPGTPDDIPRLGPFICHGVPR